MTEFLIIARDRKGRFTKVPPKPVSRGSNSTATAGIIILAIWGAFCAVVGFLAGSFHP